MTGIVGAIVFLTRIPVRTSRSLDTARSVPWFPTVGLLIGAIVGGIAALLEPWSSPFVAAGVAIVAGLLVTGAFHEDGLGDVADAFVGGWTREDRLRILKDSRHGTYGVVALVSSVALRIVALGALVEIGPKVAFAAAVAAHGAARAGAVSSMTVARPATDEGLGSEYVARIRRGHCSIGIFATGIFVTALVGWWISLVIAAVVAATSTITWWSHRKIGGVSGDVLGAIEQCGEIAVFVVLSIVATHHQLWW